MTYNTARAVVKRMQRYLDDMKEAKRNISWPTHRPKSLAYRIREAMAAVQHYEEYERYHMLRPNWKISPQEGFVEARYIGERHIDEPEREVFAPERLVYEEITGLEGAVGAAIKMEARADEIYFPNVTLTENEKLVLYEWSMGKNWKFIDQEEEGITLTRRRVDKILLWRPPKVE